MTTPGGRFAAANKMDPLEEIHQIRERVSVLNQQMIDVKAGIEKLVTRPEFDPIKLLVYGLCGCVLTGFIAAIMSKVVIK